MTEPKIEKGIPVSPRQNNGGRKRGSGPFSKVLIKMGVGDSALFDLIPNKMDAAARNAFGKGAYAVRTVEGGCRVWRLK